MTLGLMPIIQCDGYDEPCPAWSIDYYAQGMATVSGIKITRTHRAPYWGAGSNGEHYCLTHNPANEEQE